MGRGGLLVAHQSDQIKFPLAMRGVGEPYAKDASLKMLRNTLDHENWMGVLSTDNVNTAFENFIETFSMHYNNCCPMKRIKIKQYKNEKPWISKGLKCACKEEEEAVLRLSMKQEHS